MTKKKVEAVVEAPRARGTSASRNTEPEVATPAPTARPARPARAEVPAKKDAAVKGKPKAGTIIRKQAFEDGVLKYIGEVNPEYVDMIQEIKCTKVAEPNMPKIDMAFLVFSKNGAKDEEVDSAVNKEVIKEILLHYHTAVDVSKGKPVFLQVLGKTEDEPFVLTYQEYTEY